MPSVAHAIDDLAQRGTHQHTNQAAARVAAALIAIGRSAPRPQLAACFQIYQAGLRSHRRNAIDNEIARAIVRHGDVERRISAKHLAQLAKINLMDVINNR